ncbi:MAG TPA: MerR family transcriptional regulator [Chitinophagaceae bacterium]|nr:MerR family transcriptional regulator [Chitinophagaceae bacterium]
MSTTNHDNSTKVKPFTPGELASMYGVSQKTIRTWLEPHQKLIGRRRSKYYTARQIRIIFECIGEP